MSDNVVDLRSGLQRTQLDPSDRVNPELVEGLEELLAAARAGILTGGIYVFSTTQNEQMTAIYARDVSSVELLGISALGLEMVNDFIRG